MASAPVDIPIKVQGLSELQKVTARMEALEKEVTRIQKSAPKAANGIRKIGPASKGAAVGVKGLGVAFKAALGPIGAALGAISGLTAAFGILKGQDFAEAKFESLGGNAEQLVVNLRSVSNELQGQRSVAELTGAAYDVASAGFSSAAEASLVLKAASQGATGGFSDLNTVGNATTSVLNAYKLSAADATRVVDQFIQTQNDGKIVVAEYAANIGKVASAAAGLGIPLSEVNAVIAQSTAAGVQAEVAFTGLKGALARLATGEATKAISETGIKIDAASLKSDGLYKTLKKLEGLDTGQIFAALGTEAGPALLPVIQNLEKYKELLENQVNANGVAAQAAATASGTIEGAWKRVTVALENLFADQSELGQIIRFTLLAAAATVEILAAAFKVVIAPIRALINVIGGIAKAMGVITDGEKQLNDFTAVWFQVLDAVTLVADVIVDSGTRWGNFLGGLITQVAGWFQGLWGGISEGVGGVVPAITGAFSQAFNIVSEIISNFWNSLPEWLRGALSTAGSVVGGITKAVTGALDKVGNEIEFAVKNAKGAAGSLFAGGTKPTAAAVGTPTGGGSSGGGGGGGVDKAAQEAERAAKAAAKQLKAAQDLVFASENNLRLSKEMSELDKISEEAAVKRLEIEKEYGEKLEASKSAAETALLQIAQTNELKASELEKEQALKELREGAVESIDEEIAALTAKIAGKEKEYEITKKIKELEAAGVPNAAGKVNQLYALRDQAEAADELKANYESLAGSISGELTGAFKSIIDGSKSAEEALTDAFAGIADAFLNMAMKMIQEWLVMQALGILMPGPKGAAPGGGPLFGAGLNTGLPLFGSYAGGGYTGDGPRSGGVDGKGGFPAILHSNETVIDHFDAARGAMGGGGGSSEAFSENADALAVSNSYTRERVIEKERSERSTSSGTMLIETQVINNQEFATVEQVEKAAAASAQKARAQVFSDMRNRPATRRLVGMS
jgi:TP901 family phage tail tape measure protein